MATVTALEFKNYPKVSSPLVKFLAVNTGMEAQPGGAHGKLEVDVKESLRASKTAAANACTAKTLAEELQKRVGRLESSKAK